MLRYVDVLLIVVAAPVLVLTGVPAAGYGIGAAGWTVFRLLGQYVDRRTGELAHVSQVVAIRLGYRLTRVILLASIAVLTQRLIGKADGATALLVVIVGFTIQLTLSITGSQSGRPGGLVTAESGAGDE